MLRHRLRPLYRRRALSPRPFPHRPRAGLVMPCLAAPAAAQAAEAATLSGSTAVGLMAGGALLALAVAAVVAGWGRRRRGAEVALRAERERSQRLLGLFEAALWRTDAQHRLLELRPAPGAPAAPLPADASGRELWTLVDPASAPRLRARLEAQTAFDGFEFALAADAARPAPRWRLRALPCLDEHGRFAGHEGSATPLPEPAPAAPGAPAGEEAESFSYTVSHDLRAPIRVIEGFTKILKEDYGRLLDRVGNDHLERVLGAAARMNAMIDALLALSRLSAQPLARQTVNLSQLATYVIEDLRRHHPERHVEAVVAPGLQTIGDPTLLRVVLENLLGNAWKYSGQRSVAKIEFGRVSESGRSAFCVADNGAGFDMRFADRLFGVFQRLHSASDFAGTGVGLASVRRIVQRHGGEIWAEAEPDRGARFYFTLPA